MQRHSCGLGLKASVVLGFRVVSSVVDLPYKILFVF